MKNFEIKLLTLGVLTTVFISSTSIFAATRTSTSITNKTTVVIAQNVTASFKSYTSATIPPAVLAQLKSHKQSLSPSQEVFISTSSTKYEDFFYTASTGLVKAFVNTTEYDANVKLSIIGYGYQTKGKATGAAQVVLNVKAGDNLTVDSIFGSNTYNTIYNYQKTNGLSKDGVIGKATWNRLVNHS